MRMRVEAEAANSEQPMPERSEPIAVAGEAARGQVMEDKEFNELRKEIIEARNLVIKTDNLLKNLHAEMKLIGNRQQAFERRSVLSSWVAMGIVAVLCTAGAFV